MPNNFQRKPSEQIKEKFRGCLLGGAIGDALGAPVEFMRRSEILQMFGSEGLTDFVPAYGKLGAVTDDTQMMAFTAEGLLRAYVRSRTRGMCHPPSVIEKAYQRWLYTQEHSQLDFDDKDLDGWLIQHPELFSRRAPGVTCLNALRSHNRLNDSKGCGGVMRVAPVGLLYYSLLSDKNFDESLKNSFQIACEAAAITHGHPTGQLASGAFSSIVFLLLSGKSLFEAIEVVLAMLSEEENASEMINAINQAVQLANSSIDPVNAISTLGEGWIAEEALAIGIYSALAASNFQDGVILAVNHDGDSDSTGLIAGHLLGIIYGLKAIPEHWLQNLELRVMLEELADDLATVGSWQLDSWGDGAAKEEAHYYFNRYPGC